MLITQPVSESIPLQEGRSFIWKKFSQLIFKKIEKYHKEISYVATLLAIAAFVIAIFSNQILFAIITLGSALLFRVAIWSFISKEKRASDQLREQNISLSHSLEEAKEQIAVEEECKKELSRQNEEMSSKINLLNQQNQELQDTKDQLAEAVEENRTLRSKLNDALEKAALIHLKISQLVNGK